MCSSSARKKAKSRRVSLDAAHEVALADLKPIVAQDVIGGGQVEIEIGEREMAQISGARKAHVLAADLEGHRAGGGVGELLLLEGMEKIKRFGDARLKLG